MPELKQRLEEIQTSLGLNVADIQKRLGLLMLDEPQLAEFAPFVAELEALHGDALEALHQHLLGFPELAAHFRQPDTLQRLKDQQLRYYEQLLRGPYDVQYARLRLLAKLAPDAAPIDQKWHLGAYHFYLDYMRGALKARWPDDPALADRLFACLLKIVFFDLTLAVDTHAAAGRLALEESRARYARAVDGAHDGIWGWNVADDRLEVSDRWLRILGLAADQAPVTLGDWAAMMPDVYRTAFEIATRAHLAGYKPFLNIECQMRDAEGELTWVLIRGLVSEDSHGTRRLAGSLSDINLRKSAEEDLAHATFHDPLTGLPNRQRMNQLLLQALHRQTKPGARYASVLYIDLDRFKLINESLGHQSGDKVLVESAKRIGRCLRPGDHLCRFGGDEFVVLLDDLAQAGDAEIVARRIIQELQAPMLVGGQRLMVSASIGVAPLKGEGQQQDALREADLALYRAKAYGKSQLALYSDTLQQDVMHRLTLENALSEALEREQFQLYYQPIVRVADGVSRVVGVEALLRWWQEGTMISPDEFIPILEESGQIVEVGEWVLREACRQVRSWQENGLPGLRCSVNLSSRQLHEAGFAARVATVLVETGFPANKLVLEITESLLMQDVPDTLATLRELESLGIRIALDDFGTGFSSLGYLHHYPLHIIKVDKSFITRAPDDERLGAISRAIIGLGRGLSMDVIAEGIETPEQMRFLHDEGCHYIQGYWFSRPLSAELIEPVLISLSATGD